MAAAQKKAVDLMAKGEKCLTKFSFFGGGSQKYEDAAECFQDAGKMFVLAKSFDEAGKAYLRAAEMFEKTKSDFDTGSVLTRAGEAFQKAQDTRQCSEAYRRAADVFAGAGKGNMAANASKKLAELIEQDDDEDRLPEAVEAYQQATDFYDAENQPRRADGCREKVATISARLGAYDDAITQFDALGRSALQSNLGKFNAKKWFTYSVLCCLAREDLVKAQKLLGAAWKSNFGRPTPPWPRRLDGVKSLRHRRCPRGRVGSMA
jgi:alpha-soluble NSF attachment protein